MATAPEAPRARGVDLRTRFRDQPQRVRWAAWLGLELLAVLAVAAVDLSLGVALLVLIAILWQPKIGDDRVRIAIQAAVVLFLLLVEPAAAILVAIGFAVSWVPERFRQWVGVGVAIVLAVTYPFYVDRLFTIPLLGAFPSVSTGVVMLVFVMMAIGLNVVVGYAGLLDLGYVAFYAMGAYTCAWFASLQFPQVTFHFGSVGVSPELPGFHISIWLLLILAGVFTAIIGVVIGLPTLRLRGDYLAIVTLGFGEIMPQVARNGDNLFGTGFNLTNGPNGITPIDSPGFGSFNYLTGSGEFFSSARLFFWTAILLVLITVFCSWRLRDSRLGRAWIAIREDETAAAAMGVPLMRTKTWAYATGAFFGGIAGAYYASFKSSTFPGDFFFNISVFILVMVILGGMGNIWGVIFGAAFLAYLDQAGLANTGAWINGHFSELSFNLSAAALFAIGAAVAVVVADNVFAKVGVGAALGGIAALLAGVRPIDLPLDVPLYEFGIFGVILLVVMLVRPEGLIPSSRRAAELHEGVHDEPLYDATR